MIKVHTILDGTLYQRGHLLHKSLDEKAKLLESLNIRTVVGLARAHDEDLAMLLGERYIWKRIPDGAVRDPEGMKSMARDVAAQQKADGGAVLCYCSAGRNRSGLMNALLLCELTGCSGADAVDTVRSRRKNALANQHFVGFLGTINCEGGDLL